MTIITGMKDAFMDWLNECPVQWNLINQDDGSLTYSFNKESEEEEEI